MADQQSIELLALIFASRIFAYRGLAKGLSCSLSGVLSFVRENLDPVVKVDQFAQYVHDIGIAAETLQQLIIHLLAVSQCLKKLAVNSPWPNTI